jgi:copper(I)-binding protein
MRHIIPLIAGVLGLTLATAHAADYKAGSITISDPWSRATPKGAAVGVGYMKITNNGTTADRLISGSSDIAPKLEVHEMKMENGVMKMRPVQGGLEIKPGETVALTPESSHVMFVGLKKGLTAGDHVKAALVFDQAGPIDIEYEVRPMGAASGREAPGHDKPGMKMPGH